MMNAFLMQHWQQWNQAPSYLGLGAHYQTSCPPLMVMGTDAIATERPLVGISLEPLMAGHFARQVAYCTNFRRYRDWNLRYFQVFPGNQLAGPVPQAYWRDLADFVAGWAGLPATTGFSWTTFSQHYIELPFIPLHAANHRRTAFAAAIPNLVGLMATRINLVRATWPRAGFVILGSIWRDLLPHIASGLGDAITCPARDTDSEDLYGNMLWNRPTFETRLALGVAADDQPPPLFYRRGPFAQGHGPRRAGRYWLGAALRARLDAQTAALAAQ